MLSSKIDQKALLFLKHIARKEKKMNRRDTSTRKDDKKKSAPSSSQPQTSNKTESSHQEETNQSRQMEEDGAGLIIGKAKEVVTMTIQDYHHYGNILDSAEDVEAKIKKIVKDETSLPVTSTAASMDPDVVVAIAPKRGQVHRLMGKCPELATDVCDLCGYKSSKEGVLRHKQRRHPKTVYKCQVCSAGFGIRYDMRRHRLNHFTPAGQLNKRGQRLWVKNHPDVDPDRVNYRDFEENFVSENEAKTEVSGKTGEVPVVNCFKMAGHIDSNLTLQFQCSMSTNNQYKSGVVQDIEGKTEIACITDTENHSMGKSVTLSKGLTDLAKDIGRTLYTEPVGVNIPLETPRNNKITRTKRKLPRYPPKDTSRVDCPVCQQNFPQKVLAVHMKIHTEKPPMVCPYCTVEFTERCKMNVHIRGKHQNDFTCKLCGKVLGSSTGLKYHLQGAHGDKVICLLCQKKLSNQQSLYIHMTREHSNHWKHTCSQCGKKFLDRRSLQYHAVSHLDADVQDEEKRHRCLVCGKRFLRKQTLMLHQNTHVGMKPFRCEQCNKAFAFGSLLTKHMKVHSEKREFPCLYCHKAFKFACKLKYHMIIHTKERRHVCNNCDKIFTTSTGLRKHMCKSLRKYNKQHPLQFAFRAPPDMYSSSMEPYQDLSGAPTQDSETLYLCGICNMAFVSLDDVNDHVQTHDEVTVVIEDSAATYATEDVPEETPVILDPQEIGLVDITAETTGEAVIHHLPSEVTESCDKSYIEHSNTEGDTLLVHEQIHGYEMVEYERSGSVESGVLGGKEENVMHCGTVAEWVVEDGAVQCVETTIVGEETDHT